VTNIVTDLATPTEALADDAPFHLRCALAATRLGRLADLGFDDAILVSRLPTEAHLTAMRALLPR